jgi:hypothetical protein
MSIEIINFSLDTGPPEKECYEVLCVDNILYQIVDSTSVLAYVRTRKLAAPGTLIYLEVLRLDRLLAIKEDLLELLFTVEHPLYAGGKTPAIQKRVKTLLSLLSVKASLLNGV